MFDQLSALFTAPDSGEYAPYAGIGSRRTPPDVCADMTRIAQALGARGFTLRSGGAAGADQAFEEGAADQRLREIYLPAEGWRGSESELHADSIDPAVWAARAGP